MTTLATTNVALVLDEHSVPDESALAMIESCAGSIELVASIPDVKRAITMAEAVAAVTRKIDASERVKRAAALLVIRAEVQLGRLTKQIPQGRRGGAALKNPGQPTKNKVLEQHGLHRFRCNVAEKLAGTPEDVIEQALDRAKSKTVMGVATELGFRQRFAKQAPRSAMQKLAKDAIELLDRCRTQMRAPTQKEIDPLQWTFVAMENVE